MDIEFKDKRLSRQMTSEKDLKKAFGDRAKRIQMRLSVLMAAANLEEVPSDPPTRCHELKGDFAGCFGVDVSGNWRLIFKPSHDPLPLNDEGGIDLRNVTSIIILGVVDYH